MGWQAKGVNGKTLGQKTHRRVNSSNWSEGVSRASKLTRDGRARSATVLTQTKQTDQRILGRAKGDNNARTRNR